MGAVAGYAVTATQEFIDRGQVPRADGFFDVKPDGQRADAEVLLEGVLTKARDSYEEKKLPYLGRLYAAVSFDDSISPQYANYLLALAGELTYSQYVLLAIGTQNATLEPKLLRINSFRGDDAARENLDSNAVGMISELFNLDQRGLTADQDRSVWISMTDVRFGGFRIQGAGAMLHNTMGLNRIPLDDRMPFMMTFPPERGDVTPAV